MADAKKKKTDHDDRMEKYAKANYNGIRVIKKAEASAAHGAEEASEASDSDNAIDAAVDFMDEYSDVFEELAK